MQEQIESLLNLISNCTPLIVGDMNATACNNDHTSGAIYPSDKSYRSFLRSNNLFPLHRGPTANQGVKTAATTTTPATY